MTAERTNEGSPPNLESAWQLARLEAIERLHREPDESEIACHLAGSGVLRFIAELHLAPITVQRTTGYSLTGRTKFADLTLLVLG
jgi:hypothetical protein